MQNTDKLGAFAQTIADNRYAHTTIDFATGLQRKETWEEIAYRTVNNVLDALPGAVAPRTVVQIQHAVRARKFMPGGRYLYASGRPFHQTQNCLLLRAQDSREGWGQLMQHCTQALMTGAGLGVNYSHLREEDSPLARSGGTSSGPLSLMEMVNSLARGARQGGARRGAIWAGMRWSHPDIHKFINVKNWSHDLRAMKEKDFNAWAPLDCTNISVCLDDAFFTAYHMPWHPEHNIARGVYWAVIANMLETGEPGLSIDVGRNAGEDLRNACTEITTADDSDICNIGSINLARIDTIEEFRTMVELGTIFLLAGSVYSDVPYPHVRDVRTKNRRLGLGLMGVHEWLLKRGRTYGPDAELGKWLEVYAQSTDIARAYAAQYGLSAPVKTRAIAPNGTIGIVAETTTSGEPMLYVAYKRRFRDGDVWKFQYVVDPCAKRLIESGVSPDAIETADTLSADVERRVSFQAWLQTYVDHAISSTINLPRWGSVLNNPSRIVPFGEMLLKYLPHLRGITVFPDGSRGAGQPITHVPYAEAFDAEGETFVEGGDVCELTKGESCG